MLNGMDNSWIKSQLKRLEQDKVKQIEQLQAENKEQKTTIELLLNFLKKNYLG